MKKFTSLLLVVVLVMGAMLTGCSTTEATSEASDVKVGFIYVGPIGDGGWTYAHNEGREAVEAMEGVETLYRESVPEGPEVEKVIAEMVDQGLLISAKSKKDERKRLLRLSAKGKTISASLAPVWEEIRLATTAVIKETGVDLLQAIGRMEALLD